MFKMLQVAFRFIPYGMNLFPREPLATGSNYLTELLFHLFPWFVYAPSPFCRVLLTVSILLYL